MAASSSVATLVTGVLRAMFLAKLKSAAILVASGLLVVLIGTVAIPTFPQPARSARAADKSQDGKAVRIAAERVKRADIERKSTQIGTLHPFEEVAVYPRFSGYLKRLEVDIGDRVQKGDILAELEVPELAVEVSKNRALVKQAKARIARVEAAQKVAAASVGVAEAGSEQVLAEIARCEATTRFRKRELARYQDLYKQNAVPKQIVDEQAQHAEEAGTNVIAAKSQLSAVKAKVAEALAKRDEAKVDVEEALAQLEVAQSDLRKSEMLHASTTITAPFDGIVDQRNYTVGAFRRGRSREADPPRDPGRSDARRHLRTR